MTRISRGVFAHLPLLTRTDGRLAHKVQPSSAETYLQGAPTPGSVRATQEHLAIGGERGDGTLISLLFAAPKNTSVGQRVAPLSNASCAATLL